MKVHANLRELLEAWDEHRFTIVLKNDVTSFETMYEDFIASNSLSECERQPVGNNEQGGNKCKCKGEQPIARFGINEFCRTCGNEV